MEIDQLNYIEKKNALLKLEEFILVEKNFQKISDFKNYVEMWKVAFTLGKLDLSRQYCLKAYLYLLHFKRIPKIRKLILELENIEDNNFIKNSWSLNEKILLGKKIPEKIDYLDNFEAMYPHPEHWKFSREFLKEYLTIENQWGVEDWKFCYEYVLLYRFDKDIFKLMYYHFEELQKFKQCKLIKELFKKYKIQYTFRSILKVNEIFEKNEVETNLQYEDKNVLEKVTEEESSLIVSIKILNDNELKQNGIDFLLALKFLNMNHAIEFLTNKLLNLDFNLEKKLEILNFKLESYLELNKWIKTIDLVDSVVSNEEFVEFDLINFEYLRAEAYFYLKNFKRAKELYLYIIKQSPDFRMSKDRLNEIEKNK